MAAATQCSALKTGHRCWTSQNPLTKGLDYNLSPNGRVRGYGRSPLLDEHFAGVSCFDVSALGARDGASHSQQPCSFISLAPDTVGLVEDYTVELRIKRKSDGQTQIVTVAHYSIHPVEEVESVNTWQAMIKGNSMMACCQWLPCQLSGGEEELDNGWQVGDYTGLRNRIYFLFVISKHTFSTCNPHDKVLLNALMTRIVIHKPTDIAALCAAAPRSFMREVYRVLFLHARVSTQAGMLLDELEDVLDFDLNEYDYGEQDEQLNN